jgi:hypothetical protein
MKDRALTDSSQPSTTTSTPLMIKSRPLTRQKIIAIVAPIIRFWWKVRIMGDWFGKAGELGERGGDSVN